ncbi:Excinuclease ATPase subunit [Thermoplasmatales archaeon BRNA1]|nr:Excinuclease ATPase subunit [Thermoplasmatales archaeon BRNA1]
MADRAIEIRGASENNLKGIDVDIPKGKIVVLAGVSGSGKSSLAFDTVAKESHRQWQLSYPLYLRNRMPRYERPAVESINNLTPAIVVDQKILGANSRSTVGTASDIAPLVRLLFSRIGKPSAGPAIAYSFNHPLGMCPDCHGIGKRLTVDIDKMLDLDKSINENAIRFTQFSTGSWQGWLYYHCPVLDPAKKLRDYSETEWKNLVYGPDTTVKMMYISNNTGLGQYTDYEGIVPRFNRLYLSRDISLLSKKIRDEVAEYSIEGPCDTCGGTGLNPKALESRILGYNISDMYDMQVSDLLPVLQRIDDPLGKAIARQISDSLAHMVDVGLGYLSLSRRTDSLSGGEVQRLKMVRHLGSSLSDITYIFDEPTAGLHPEDASRIGKLMMDLRDKHNTVLVVEHNRLMINLADHVIEIGPLAGEHGGEVVFSGPLSELKRADTLTAKALRNRFYINRNPLPWTDGFEVKNANLHNLKDVSVTIPKGILTAVTGVAGSGKSTLICQVFASRHPEAIVIDQKPIGSTSRSTPATYTGVFDRIRKLFAEANNVGLEWFSFNSKGGCPICKGKGEIVPDVAFADPVAILCEGCQGKRYNDLALSYRYKGKTIEEVNNLTIEQAMEFFEDRQIRSRLQCLMDVGMGYMTLGQQTSTLSGGENQRLKLASELHRKGAIYVLDEPTSGLHAKDVGNLLSLLRRMVAADNTVIIVEHRLEMVSQADWIIDMGPEGGNLGGRILFEGTPEQLLSCRNSYTAKHLRDAMDGKE